MDIITIIYALFDPVDITRLLLLLFNQNRKFDINIFVQNQ